MDDKISARREKYQIYLNISEPKPKFNLCAAQIKGTTNREEDKIKLFIFYPEALPNLNFEEG